MTDLIAADVSQTKPGSPEWHALRRTGIGGSDAAAAVGLSKWKSRLHLYLEKIGEAETAENEPMRWGTILEPIVRQEYANQTGRTIVTPGTVRHPTKDFALVNVDGIADGERLYEGKTARVAEGWGEPGTDEIPPEYLIQVQHGMAVVGLEIADVAVLIGGSDFRIYTVPADRELQELLLDQEERFWRDHVLAGVPPAPVSAADVKRRWRVSNGLAMPAEPALVQAVNELASIKAWLSELEKYERQITTVIQCRMGEAAELTGEAGVLATWKNVNASPKFDVQAFREAHPDLYSQFLREPAPQRRFLTKVKGDTKCLPQPKTLQLLTE